MGIYYHSILISLDLTQFTYSNYVFCNSNWNTRVSFDLDLVAAKLGHYIILHKFHVLTYSFRIIKRKGEKKAHTGLKKGDIHSEVLRGDKSISCFPLLPSRSVAFLRLGASQ